MLTFANTPDSPENTNHPDHRTRDAIQLRNGGQGKQKNKRKVPPDLTALNV